MEKPRKFLVLDALRGVAALAVVQIHTARFFGRVLFPHGHLAVDFFFMLSGFVLAFAYQERLDRGWSTGGFLKARLVRLYPLYFLGLLLGALFELLRARFGHPQLTIKEVGLLTGLGLFFLPALPFVGGAWEPAYPLNIPTWSLLLEVIANLVHALFLRNRARGFLLGMIALPAACLVAIVVAFGTLNFGYNRVQMLYGVPRVLFSYTVGVLLFRLWRSGRFKVSVSPVLAAAVLLALMAVPTTPALYGWYDLAVIFFLFPPLILASTYAQPLPGMVLPAHLLGVTSYAIYVIHEPLSLYFELAWVKVRHRSIDLDAPWGGILYLFAAVALSILADRIYDTPIRSFLRKKLG